MLHKLRTRAQSEKGFTLIELLVVILIIGILAAIALPAFLNQRSKAQDTEAKSAARTAQTAMETYYTDEQNYRRTCSALRAIEPALDAASRKPASRSPPGVGLLHGQSRSPRPMRCSGSRRPRTARHPHVRTDGTKGCPSRQLVVD